MRRYLQFRLSTILLLILICGLALGWWKDRSALQRELNDISCLRQVMRQAVQRHVQNGGQTPSAFRKMINARCSVLSDKAEKHFLRKDVRAIVTNKIISSEGEVTMDLPQFADLMKNSDSLTRLTFVWALQAFAEDPKRLLVAALEDSDEDVRWCAFGYFLTSWDPDATAAITPPAIRALRTTLNQRPSPFAVCAAALLMRLDPSARTVAKIVQMMDRGDSETRHWAAALLADFGPDVAGATVPVLLQLLDDLDEGVVRSAAVTALGNLATPNQAMSKLLKHYSVAESKEARYGIARAIERIELRAAKSFGP